ncbi:hypothetical protein CLC_2340 [Clostridium botulinum A str. Hall]|nr:hypothetical protein CLB_2358 [Clostridium botulinum A str. ATCC 19397]ABS36936.1 hypothetical protein CLC_2340 [Clostridium botulinum A str. Hall]
MYFIIVCLGTQVSKSPNNNIIGGSTASICLNESSAIKLMFCPLLKSINVIIKVSINIIIKKTYLFNHFIKSPHKYSHNKST